MSHAAACTTSPACCPARPRRVAASVGMQAGRPPRDQVFFEHEVAFLSQGRSPRVPDDERAGHAALPGRGHRGQLRATDGMCSCCQCGRC